ncbi:MFS transporter [Nocardia sp. NPDC049149]|uniref:MFS transporter n=1 Tax=Nocardia sp. NPDC049149 TaxID=3364315 RepID=UPI00371BC047
MVSTTALDRSETVSESAWLGPGLALAVMGWGANQFPPLIALYARELGLTAAVLNAIFGLYALGLIPALLIGGRLSDRLGRKPIVLVALAISAVGTCLLIYGGEAVSALFAGRLLSGVANGLAFGTGAVWVKELSSTAGDAAAGPRRATVAMTIGFSAGPLVSGLCAQWLGAPTVLPYLPHLVLLAIAVVAVRRAPDPRRHAMRTASMTQDTATARRPGVVVHFMLVLLPFAPWVFGTAAIALAYLPALIAPQIAGHAMAFGAVVIGLAASAGIVVQPLIRRIPHPESPRLLLISMGVALVGIGVAAVAARWQSPWMVFIASVLLGVAYGFTQFRGLVEVQQIVGPHALGTATAVYQILTYLGFAVPFLLSIAQSRTGLSPATLLLIVGGIAAVATGWLAVITRTYTHRHLYERPRQDAATESSPVR